MVGTSKEKEMFLSNVAMLVSSGMDMASVLRAAGDEIRSPAMRKAVERLAADIDNGLPLWRAFEKSRLFPPQALALVKIGESSGRLMDNLRVVAASQERERSFRSKLQSAMIYPLFVMGLSVVIALGIAWFILPNLSNVFSQLNMELPLITRLLIGLGEFLGKYGAIAVPLALAVFAATLFFVFIFPRTRHIGQAILLHTPGVSRLLSELELARLGYIVSSLLSAGLPLVEALRALESATTLRVYQRFYTQLRQQIEDGSTFQQAFKTIRGSRRRLPVPLQHMIMAAENAARLEEAFQKIATLYEGKTENTTKNLTVVLEPLLLVIVWVGVLTVALAIILPIYSLIGGLNNSI